jgi:hypothetical protein
MYDDLGVFFSWMKERNIIIEQFTGMTDCEGREIYEGDIIEFTVWWFDGNIAESQLTGQVVWADDLMSFQLKGVKNAEWERYTGHENDDEYLTPFSALTFCNADFRVLARNSTEEG